MKKKLISVRLVLLIFLNSFLSCLGIETQDFWTQTGSKATSLTKWPSSQLIFELKTSISIT
jgi:hypothetical protein